MGGSQKRRVEWACRTGANAVCACAATDPSHWWASNLTSRVLLLLRPCRYNDWEQKGRCTDF